MNFPRPFIKIGKCVAVIDRSGRPYTNNRYKCIGRLESNWYAHRLSYSLNVKKIPRLAAPKRKLKHDMVLHHCDHKWCIEPSHLYLGRHSQNSNDFWGRNKAAKRRHKMTMARITSTKEFRHKLSDACRGIPKTEEHKRKIGDATRRRYANV